MLKKIMIAMSCCMVVMCEASKKAPSVLLANPMLYNTHYEILQDVGKQIASRISSGQEPKDTSIALLKEAGKCLQAKDIYTASFVMELLDNVDLLIQFVIGTEVKIDKKELYESCEENKRILGEEIEKKYKEIYGI